MLYGVRTDLQRQLVKDGYRIRIYIPYGRDWFPYFMRRLAERPANLVFFLATSCGPRPPKNMPSFSSCLCGSLCDNRRHAVFLQAVPVSVPLSSSQFTGVRSYLSCYQLSFYGLRQSSLARNPVGRANLIAAYLLSLAVGGVIGVAAGFVAAAKINRRLGWT